jgi:hypothetical protein
MDRLFKYSTTCFKTYFLLSDEKFCEVNAGQSAPLLLGPGSIPASVSNSTNKVKIFYIIK